MHESKLLRIIQKLQMLRSKRNARNAKKTWIEYKWTQEIFESLHWLTFKLIQT